jgi:hypothetical protein
MSMGWKDVLLEEMGLLEAAVPAAGRGYSD